MLRWPDYVADPPSDTTSGDVNERIQRSLKGRPRETLQFKTPSE